MAKEVKSTGPGDQSGGSVTGITPEANKAGIDDQRRQMQERHDKEGTPYKPFERE
jgi:hypothetical protein